MLARDRKGSEINPFETDAREQQDLCGVVLTKAVGPGSFARLKLQDCSHDSIPSKRCCNLT